MSIFVIRKAKPITYMATNKHAMIRYQALDACFSNKYRKYYIEDLIDACNKALEDFYLPKENAESGESFYVKRRTIFNDIAYMESSKGWSAPIGRFYEGHRCYYRYEEDGFTINKKDFSDAELDTIDEALVMLNRFKGVEGFDWVDEFVTNFEDKLGRKKNEVPVIGYQKNPYLKGIEKLSAIYHYIVNRQVLKITYEHFVKGSMVHIVHPYYLKEYNNRWFLFGITEQKRDSLISLPLDRIISIVPIHIAYIPNTQFNFEEYFEDVVGVSVPMNGTPDKVLLRFEKSRFPYVETKPLHPSQKIIDKDDCIVQIEVHQNSELDSLIFSFGDQVEVLAPDSLRNKIKARIKNLSEKYK